jgi:patatin-like phospholipase/acyl hydrolase
MKFLTPTDVSKFDPEQQDALLAEMQQEALRILRAADPERMKNVSSERDRIVMGRSIEAAIQSSPAAATMFAQAAQARESLRETIEKRRAPARCSGYGM